MTPDNLKIPSEETNYYIRLQKKSKKFLLNIYFDVTFKTVSEIFSELFTVYATYFTIKILCVYALMKR
ncbi:LOW QUALITY PROTEIN: hypothetical protein HZS_5412 [Henneguya salminicola]|nr:LOW QUALITY PROTEIN: hypothetical protein HZS_5412 [Henneguya salminicola]